jgi:hypothetical protein
MIGTIQEVGSSQSGNPKLKINGDWYSAGRVDVSSVSAGMKVDFSWNEFGTPGRNGKKPRGLVDLKPVTNSAGQPETGSTVTDADVLRSVSNVVGNACAAGIVKSPDELEKWFQAAYLGFSRMGKDRTQPQRPKDPEFVDDELPDNFYQGLPPPNNKAW